jgi:hypothetical protein
MIRFVMIIVTTLLVISIMVITVMMLFIVMIALVMAFTMMLTMLHMESFGVLKFVTLAACESKARSSNPNHQMTQRFHEISLRVAMSFCNFQVFSYNAGFIPHS